MNKIELLIDEYGSSIYNFCLYLAKNKQDGEDLFQETFLRAIEIESRIDKNKNAKSYLISIAINIWRNSLQKKARRQRIAPEMSIDQMPVPDLITDVENSVISKIANNEILEVINRLDDKYRVPVILFYSEDMKTADIARLIKKPEGTVKRRLHDARRKIKKELEEKGYG